MMRVLLVEDSSDLRSLFARVLKGNGFEVCEAANGREALDCLPGFEPDVVLTDLMMPEVDGFELIRRLRAMPTMAEVPIVAMTAAAGDETEAEVRRAGVTEFLEKPFDSRSLLASLEELGPELLG
jgi:CheY-like chemotaxis protein